MSLRALLRSTASASALLAGFVGPAAAGDTGSATAGAVSAANADLSVFTGTLAGDVTLGSAGSFSVPLSSAWGAQVDGLLGTRAGSAFYGVGGHLFTRDPSRGLLGLYGSYLGWGSSWTTPVNDPLYGIADVTGANVGKVGVEGEAYLGRVSLEGLAAYQFGTDTGIAGRGVLAYYPTDNLRLSAGYSFRPNSGGGLIADVEWAPNDRASLFLDAAASGSATTALVGVKAYFGGGSKSLIRREREDDPPNMLPDDLYTIVGNGYCPVGTHETNGYCDSNS